MPNRKKKDTWTWTPCAVGERPKTGTEPVTLAPDGSDYAGDVLYALSGPDGVAPAMTAAEWRNFALAIVSGDSPVRG